MKRLIVFMAIALSLSGCGLKSVTEGEADDIEKARIYSFNGKDYLVMFEAVYQVTSKEYNRGISMTTGYNEYRISVYSLDDGSLIARKKTGRQQKSPVIFLGCTEGNLWFYSSVVGIHSLDPVTLETRISQGDIISVNPELENHFAACEWYQLPQYFQFNEISNRIVITDDQGYRYFIDPGNLKSTRITWEYRSFEPWRDRPFVTSNPSGEPSLYLSGDLRKQISVYGKEVNAGLSFLDGRFIADRNPSRVLAGLDNRLSDKMKKLEVLYIRIMELKSLNGGNGPARGDSLRDSLRLMENERYRLESDIRSFEEYRTDLTDDGASSGYTGLLSPDTTSFLVFHKSGTQKDARVMISKIRMKDDSVPEAVWEKEISGLFHDPSDAGETNAFREVFSKGSPEFGFSFFDISDNRLIIVWMLHVYCLDTDTGSILWWLRV